jgi:hypothetical protein
VLVFLPARLLRQRHGSGRGAAVAWFAVGGEHQDEPGGQRQHRVAYWPAESAESGYGLTESAGYEYRWVSFKTAARFRAGGEDALALQSRSAAAMSVNGASFLTTTTFAVIRPLTVACVATASRACLPDSIPAAAGVTR